MSSVNMSRVAFYLGHIWPAGHFEIGLCKYGSEVSEALCDSILDGVVSPIVGSCDQAHLFGTARETRGGRTRKRQIRPPFPCLSKTHSSIELALSKMPIDDKHRKYWRYALMSEVNLVLRFREEDFPIDEIAPKSWDPHLLTNLQVVAAASAMKYCRDMTSQGGCVCCLFTKDSGSISMSLYASKRILKMAYTRCVKACRFTGRGLENELRPKSKGGHCEKAQLH